MKKLIIALTSLLSIHAFAGVLEYGDEDVLGTGTYASDPKAGATLFGLGTDVVTYSSLITGHGFPFSPGSGDYAGTNQIYVGSTQTAGHDGYSGYGSRVSGPQVITMDYSSLVPTGQQVTSLTLGIAADDFQNAVFGQPYSASINGFTNTTLTNTLNAFNQTGPVVQFFTIGLNTATLTSNNLLTLSINEGGDGGDGWAVDFLTVGVQTAPVPEPGTWAALSLGGLALVRRRRSKV